MHYNKTLLILAAFAILLFSCSKSDTPATPANNYTPYPNNLHLYPGNYWIYEEFNIDSNGNTTATGLTDSLYVEKDTLINNIPYLALTENIQGDLTTLYLRDIAGNTVDQYGNIYYSKDLTDTLSIVEKDIINNDTATGYGKMEDKTDTTIVPAGKFVTANYELVIMHTSPKKFQITGYHKYAASVGLVLQTIRADYRGNTGVTWYTEDRLLRYSIK